MIKVSAQQGHLCCADDQFKPLFDQAVAAADAQEFSRALELFERAIALNPGHAESYYKRGNVLKNLGRLPAAIASYDQAIERKPDYAFAYCNRGVTQQALGLMLEALSSYESAIAHDPSDAVTHYNRALLLQECARWDEVLESYDRAIAIDPMYADAQYNRSLALLYCGDFEPGWRSYEWRWKNAKRLGLGEVRNFPQPLWLGEQPLAGKRLLLHSEGGLGDTIQFCRYAQLAAARGAKVFLEIQAPLQDLLSGVHGVSEVIVKGGAVPEFDYHCPLMSLPLAFRTTLDSIPPAPGGLQSDKTKVARWNSLHQIQQIPRIGLVWSGNPNNAIDQRRSIRLADLVARLPAGFEYFRLQREVRREDQAVLDSSPIIRSDNFDVQDFLHTAALCACMDLVISVDTSIAHLSGTLGRPTWLLLPFIPDWRWLRDREDSPWYPTMRLFRQRTSGDWSEVLDRVAVELRGFAKSRRAGL
jgi:tetratricopeptide (TPR) repeat protein